MNSFYGMLEIDIHQGSIIRLNQEKQRVSVGIPAAFLIALLCRQLV